MKKRLLSLGLIAAMAMSLLTGCSSSSGNNAASSVGTEGGASSASGDEVTFTIGFQTEPPSMDPKDFNSTAATLIGYDCYDTLLNFSMQGSDLEPALAESWEQVDETTYVYKIREGVKFSNGDDMTMEDVLFSMNRVIDEAYSMSYLFENVDSFEVNEETYELTVHLKQADATWKYVPATSPCSILDKSVVEAEGDNYGQLSGSCVGTGPYMLDSWESGAEIVTVKNPNYWGDPETLDVDKVVYEVIADGTSRALAAKSGQIDYARNMNAETLPTYKEAANMSINAYDATDSVFLAFNCDKAPFDDVNARKAIAYCIDKESYTTLIGGEYATPQGAFILPRTMFYLDEDAWNEANDTLESYQQNYDKAAEALAASAYAEGFEFDYYTTPTMKTGAEAIQSMIKESGLPITMNIVEMQEADSFSVSYGYTVDEDGHRVYDMLSAGWVSDWLDPTGYMKNCLDGGSNYQGGANRAAWVNDDFDALLDASYLETDDSVRSQQMLDAMKIAVEDCPYVPMYEYQSNYIISDKFEYEEGPNFFWNFTVANVHVK